MHEPNPRAGMALMIAATFVFGLQDGISKHLAAEYNVFAVVMIRYWFFAAFVLAVAARRPGGIPGVMKTAHPRLQVARGVLLAVEICVMVTAFVLLGLVESHAVFACYPLLISALSGPVLGEHVGWRRWSAVGAGFVGVMIILQPGMAVFSPYALIALASAFMFALYGLLTRYISRTDSSETSLFWIGVAGAPVMTAVGLWNWEPIVGFDWAWMLLLCVSGVLGHWLLLRAYDYAEASAVQPFAYMHLVFASAIGVLFFSESLELNVIAGALLIIVAGLFTLRRERIKSVEVSRPGGRGGV